MAPEQTLRERWNIWAKEKNLCTDCTAMSEEFFLAQFDAMLAEDIELLDGVVGILSSLEYDSFEKGCKVGVTKAKSILEARRLSLKK